MRCALLCLRRHFGASSSRRLICSSQTPRVHPTVDCAALLSDAHPERPVALARMREAVQEHGYFYAANVDVLPADYISEVYDYLRRAHALPLSVKKQYVAPHGGYSGFDAGKEHAEMDYEAGKTSSVRSWDYSRTRFTRGDNNYPSPEILRPSMSSYLDGLYERQNVLGQAILVGWAEMLDLQRDTFSKHFDAGDLGTIRLLYYPGSTEEAVTDAGITAHTDFEAFTLMHQDAPGLQFLSRDGSQWIDAPVRPGEFVVIVGDVIERFTNGELKAMPHRVVKTSHPRCSIIRFNAVHPKTRIEPLQQFVSMHRPALYTPVTMERHMQTTMDNLRMGKGAWDTERNCSKTATYVYKQAA